MIEIEIDKTFWKGFSAGLILIIVVGLTLGIVGAYDSNERTVIGENFTNVQQIGDVSNLVENVFIDQIDSNSIDTEQIFSNLDNDRPLWLTSNKEVTVDPAGGADYTSVQDALNNEHAYIYADSRLTIFLNDATYDEDVIIREFLGSYAGGRTIQIRGNETTPENVNGLSFTIKSTIGGSVLIQGVKIDRETTDGQSDEDSGVVAINCDRVSVAYCEFGDIRHGATSYGTDELQIQEVDFGSDLEHAIRTKHSGGVLFQTVGAENITGTTSDAALAVSTGIVYYHSDATLSGSPLAEASQGFVINEKGKILAGFENTLRGSPELVAQGDINDVSSISETLPDLNYSSSKIFVLEIWYEDDELGENNPLDMIWSGLGDGNYNYVVEDETLTATQTTATDYFRLIEPTANDTLDSHFGTWKISPQETTGRHYLVGQGTPGVRKQGKYLRKGYHKMTHDVPLSITLSASVVGTGDNLSLEYALWKKSKQSEFT